MSCSRDAIGHVIDVLAKDDAKDLGKPKEPPPAVVTTVEGDAGPGLDPSSRRSGLRVA